MATSAHLFSNSYPEDNESWQMGASYCTNCTGRVCLDSQCEDCGHCAEQDCELLDVKTCKSLLHGLANLSERVAIAWDERMALHEEGRVAPHPERPDRILAIVTRLVASGTADRCVRLPCREASTEELQSVHTAELVEFVEGASAGARHELGVPALLTSDSYVNAHTHLCARLAAGSAAEVASAVAKGEAAHGAAIIRPPGHHAESGMAMGFCFFNNAAVAARAAQAAGAQRVLIMDWDVHHGNGTQHIFDDDPAVMYMSLHRYDRGSFYPGTGAVGEVGTGRGEGFTVNVPWNARDMGNGDYLSAFQLLLIPVAYEFKPDLIIVSAGFDAAEGDPIGECRLTPECFAHMTAMLKQVAPCVLLLEGGYNLRATAVSTEACLRVLLGDQPPLLPGPRYPSAAGWHSISEAIEVHAAYWMCLCHARCRRPAPALQHGVGVTSKQGQEAVSCSDGSYYANNEKAPETERGPQGEQPPLQGGRGPRSRWGRFLSSSGVSLHRRRRLPHKHRILLSIHQRAMRALWLRQSRPNLRLVDG